MWRSRKEWFSGKPGDQSAAKYTTNDFICQGKEKNGCWMLDTRCSILDAGLYAPVPES